MLEDYFNSYRLSRQKLEEIKALETNGTMQLAITNKIQKGESLAAYLIKKIPDNKYIVCGATLEWSLDYTWFSKCLQTVFGLDEKKLKKEFAAENLSDNAKQEMTAFILLNQLANEMNENVLVTCNGVAQYEILSDQRAESQPNSQGNLGTSCCCS